MKTSHIDYIVSLLITILGVFIALFFDGLVNNIKSKKRFRKTLNLTFVVIQNNIFTLNAFVIGIDQITKPFKQKPPGSFPINNIPNCLSSLDLLLSNEDLVKFTSSRNLISLLNHSNFLKTFYLYLSDYKSLNINNFDKQTLSSLIQKYQMISLDIINMYYKTKKKYDEKSYNEIICSLNNNILKSVYLKKINHKTKYLLKNKENKNIV